MTEAIPTNAPRIKRKHSIWFSQKQDTSPVSRLRFTENEWKAILEAVTFQADYLAQQQYPIHREFWVNHDYFWAHEADPNSEKGKLWTFHTDKCGELKNRVAKLNLIERQLMIHFKMIDGSDPAWIRTKDRMMQ